jgi:hypothetical protein
MGLRASPRVLRISLEEATVTIACSSGCGPLGNVAVDAAPVVAGSRTEGERVLFGLWPFSFDLSTTPQASHDDPFSGVTKLGRARMRAVVSRPVKKLEVVGSVIVLDVVPVVDVLTSS